MASYHTNFNFLNKNSADEGFIVAAFDPDEGFTDAFLSMDQVSEDYFDGTKKFLYGTRYNTTATISITLIKADGSDFTIADNRKALRWLTGARTASWLDLYNGEKFQYSFLGTMTTPQQYKLDGRVIGISVEFASITPWAFSAPQVFDCSIWQLLDVTEDGVLYKGDETSPLGVHDGVLCVSSVDQGSYFSITDDGIVFMDNMYRSIIDNKSDDLYTYIYLDIDYTNENGTYVSIQNKTLNEESLVTDISPNESIQISAKQFIISDIPNKVFGDTFNFVWPRLQPGANDFVVDGNGRGAAKFTYRYPMKVGDCAMDISTYGGGTGCCDGGEIPTYDTVRWQDITGTPTSIAGYGITDVYTKSDVYTKDETYSRDMVYTKNDVYSKDEVYTKDETYSTDEVYTKIEVDDKIDDIEISGGSGTGSVTIDEEKLNSMLDDILN